MSKKFDAFTPGLEATTQRTASHPPRETIKGPLAAFTDLINAVKGLVEHGVAHEPPPRDTSLGSLPLCSTLQKEEKSGKCLEDRKR